MSSNVNLWKPVIPLQSLEREVQGKEKSRDCHCCHCLNSNRASKQAGKGVCSPG